MVLDTVHTQGGLTATLLQEEGQVKATGSKKMGQEIQFILQLVFSLTLMLAATWEGVR